MYRKSNANLTSYGAGFRVWLVSLVATLMGVQVHIEGFPFGGPSNLAAALQKESATQ